MAEDKDFGELLEQYMDQEKMHHFESESGVRNLHKIAKAIGYRSGLDEMLADNQFLQLAIVEALSNRDDFGGEWSDKLKEELCEEEEEHYCPACGYEDCECPPDVAECK